MPVHCVKKGGKWRVVERGGKVAKTPNGKPRDGGGHTEKARCQAQAAHINGYTKR